MTMVRDFSTMSIGLSRTVSSGLIGLTEVCSRVSSIARRCSFPAVLVMSISGVWNLSGSGDAVGLGVPTGADGAGGCKSGVAAFFEEAGVAAGATLLRFLPGFFTTGSSTSSSMSIAVGSGSTFSCDSSSFGSTFSATGSPVSSGSIVGCTDCSGSTLSSLTTLLLGRPRRRGAAVVGAIVWSGSANRLDSPLGSTLVASGATLGAALFLGRPRRRLVSVCGGVSGWAVFLLPTDLRVVLAGAGVNSSSSSSAAGGEGGFAISSSSSDSMICLRFAAARRVGRVDMVGGRWGGVAT